jgi:hypothetical protein
LIRLFGGSNPTTESFYSRVTQGSEYFTDNEEVGGSNPPTTTKNSEFPNLGGWVNVTSETQNIRRFAQSKHRVVPPQADNLEKRNFGC